MRGTNYNADIGVTYCMRQALAAPIDSRQWRYLESIASYRGAYADVTALARAATRKLAK